MTIEVSEPSVADLSGVLRTLREWQHEDAPMQLHPGDIGWFWRFGAEATAAAVRTWGRDGRTLAVGLLDGPDLLRLTIAPDMKHDETFALALVRDLTGPERGVLPPGTAFVEAPTGVLLDGLLDERGWKTDEPWTPLRRVLAEPVEDAGVRVEVVGREDAHLPVALLRASFDGSTSTVEGWRAMADGPAFAEARCLVAFDDRGEAVATVTVWSAGPGRPGLIEPMGVHREHRGQGYGTAITRAAAAALRELGSSSAIVCTPTSNPGAVATYASAGFDPGPERRDRRRA